MDAESIPVLVVDDDPNILRMICDIFEMARIEAVTASSGREAFERLAAGPVRLALLDMQLPDTYGIQLFQQIRARYPELPCIFVSGVDQEMDIVLGLELGAEDYVTKPFRPRELLTRVNKVLRRTTAQSPPPLSPSPAPAAPPPPVDPCLRHGPLCLDPERREVSLASSPVTLTRAEFDLLWLLARHPGQVFSRRQILERLWADDLDVSERIVDTHIRHLREKLEPEPGSPRLLHTVRGVGYSFREGTRD